MRDHDLELIAALVEGRLEDETEARALIQSAPEMQAEYEAQKLAFETLRGAPPAALSDTERARLHRDVWTELRAGSPARPPHRPWYYSWVSVAAGLFVIVGLVAVLNQSGGPETANFAASMTTVAQSLSEESADGEDAGSDSAGGGAEAPATPDTTAAGATVSTQAVAEDAETAQLSAEAENVRQGAYGGDLQAYEEAGTTRSSTVEACVEQADLDGYQIAAILGPALDEITSTTTSDDAAQSSTTTTVPDTEQRLAVAYPENTDLATAPIAFVDLSSCEVVYLDE